MGGDGWETFSSVFRGHTGSPPMAQKRWASLRPFSHIKCWWQNNKLELWQLNMDCHVRPCEASARPEKGSAGKRGL